MCWMAVHHFINTRSITKIMHFLGYNERFDFPKSEIARQTGMSLQTLDEYLPILLQIGVVKCTRKHGKSFMYKINFENPIVASLRHLETDMNHFIKNPRPLPDCD